MRETLAILFLGVYMILAMLKPLAPYVYYAANKTYIAEELCENKDKPQLKCDGKCYLRAQLAESYSISLEEEAPLPNNAPKETKNWNQNLMFENLSDIRTDYILAQFYHLNLMPSDPLIKDELAKDLCDLTIFAPPPQV